MVSTQISTADDLNGIRNMYHRADINGTQKKGLNSLQTTKTQMDFVDLAFPEQPKTKVIA